MSERLSLMAAIHRHATEQPGQRALVFLDVAGTEKTIATFAALMADLRRAAWVWHQQEVQPGDVVLLALDHSYDLVVAFLGALYAGAVPVILPYPRPRQMDADHQRLLALADHTHARAVLTTEPIATRAAIQDEWARSGCRVCVLDLTQADVPPPGFNSYERSDDAPLYLQLTSGTTGTQKLAVLSQKAVMLNIERLFEARHRAGGAVIGCMPFSHDGGLVLCLLIPLVMGQLSVHLSPANWVARPELLLAAVTTYQGGVTFLPNFALSFMVRRIAYPFPAPYDLSSLHTIIVGAELVTYASLASFQQHFTACNLQDRALCGTYGMAEQVVNVSITPLGRPTRVDWVVHDLVRADATATSVQQIDTESLAVIGCGMPLPDVEVMIVNRERSPLPERHIGEVLLRTPFCFDRYYGRPDLTAQVMRDGWYCTGDLGYLAEGELFILGRKDDLIIVGGQNIQPQAIEEVATAVLEQRGRLAVAFGVRDEALGTQSPVLVCETRDEESADQLAAWRAEIVRQVNDVLDITLADIRFVPKGWVVQSDAKIGRAANREKYLVERPLPAPTDLLSSEVSLSDRIVHLWQSLLGDVPINPDDNFFALGGDSLTSLHMLLEIEEQFGVKVDPEFFQSPTVANLVRLLSPEQAAPPTPSATSHKTPVASRTPRHRRLIERGPLFRGHALPYGLGVRLQRAWLATPGVRHRLFRREIELLNRWGDLVGEQHPEAAIRQSLLANTWASWRNQVLSVPLGTSPWVAVQGDPTLWAPRRDGRGIIFLVLHSELSVLFVRSLTAGGHQPLFIRGWTGDMETRTQDRSVQVYRAYQSLRRGETVIIAGDGGKGKQGITVPFFGGQRLFRQGAAELAVQTGSLLVPVFCTLATTGQVTIEVSAPLSAGSGSSQAQIKTLTRAYADLLVERWPRVYSYMAWGNLARWLKKVAPDKCGAG